MTRADTSCRMTFGEGPVGVMIRAMLWAACWAEARVLLACGDQSSFRVKWSPRYRYCATRGSGRKDRGSGKIKKRELMEIGIERNLRELARKHIERRFLATRTRSHTVSRSHVQHTTLRLTATTIESRFHAHCLQFSFDFHFQSPVKRISNLTQCLHCCCLHCCQLRLCGKTNHTENETGQT